MHRPGVHSVKAILIYPMNALANDQLDRLRDMLGGTGITFGQWVGTKSAALRPLLIQERVAQCAEQVAEVVLTTDDARPGEHARVGLLHEVLGVLARAAEGPGGPEEPVDVISEPCGVERALHRVVMCGGDGVRASIERLLESVRDADQLELLAVPLHHPLHDLADACDVVLLLRLRLEWAELARDE